MQYQEFPKRMFHPQHTAAVWHQLEGKGKGLFAPDTICTQPERFPDVVVATLDQEKQYAAKGYRPVSLPDPAAYEVAILDAQPMNGYQHQEYPKWRYHAIKVPVVVQNAEEDAALGEGWSDTPIIATEDDLASEDLLIERRHATTEVAAPAVGYVDRNLSAKQIKNLMMAGIEVEVLDNGMARIRLDDGEGGEAKPAEQEPNPEPKDNTAAIPPETPAPKQEKVAKGAWTPERRAAQSERMKKVRKAAKPNAT